MGRVLAIARKDLLQRFRDRSAIVIGFLVPFGLVAVFSLTLSDVDEEGDFSATYAVADEDGGEVAGAFVSFLEDLDFAEIRAAESPGDASALVEDGDADAAFVIPEGFSASASAGRGGELRVVVEPQAGIAGLIARSLARSYASEIDAVGVSVATVLGDRVTQAEPAEVDALVQAARAIGAPAEVDRQAAESRLFSATTFYAAGMAVFFVFFTVEFGVRSLLQERQDGTLARLLVAPLRPSTIISAKALASFAVGLVSMSALVLASAFLLGAEWGDPLGVAALVLVGVMAAMGMTALVATLARTPAQASSYASVMAVVMGLLGGTFFPVSQGPGVLVAVSFLTPHAWLMRGFQELASGGDLVGVLPAVGAVLAFAVVAGGLALSRAGRLVPR